MKNLIMLWNKRKTTEYRIKTKYVNGVREGSIPMVRKGAFKGWQQIVKIYDRYYDDINIEVSLTEQEAQDHIIGYAEQVKRETKVVTVKYQPVEPTMQVVDIRVPEATC